MAELGKVLDELVNGRSDMVILKGGLHLQYKTGDGTSRLCCYRIGIEPSDVEIAVVRRELQALLPDRIIQERRPFTYTGSDKKVRYCRVLVWALAVVQLGLGAVETAVAAKYE